MIPDISEKSTLTVEEVRNRVLAHGMNTVYRSYERDLKAALDQYILSDLKEVMGYWKWLDGNLKVQIVTLHENTIYELLTSK